MDADGTKAGYDIALTAAISAAVPIPVIASGGAGNLDHMVEVLDQGKADAVLAASIFHFGEYTVADVKGYTSANTVFRCGRRWGDEPVAPLTGPVIRGITRV